MHIQCTCTYTCRLPLAYMYVHVLLSLHIIFIFFVYRQKIITNTTSLTHLVEKYLPMELRQEIIPMARSGNKIFPGNWLWMNCTWSCHTLNTCIYLHNLCNFLFSKISNVLLATYKSFFLLENGIRRPLNTCTCSLLLTYIIILKDL